MAPIRFHLNDFKTAQAVIVISVDTVVVLIDICSVARGSCNLHDTFKNEAFQKIIQDGDNPLIEIETIAVCKDMCDAQNMRHSWLQRNGWPECNLRPSKNGRANQVLCVETGQTFNSQIEASRALKVSQSALSNHLKGRPGFKTVKGLTFKYA